MESAARRWNAIRCAPLGPMPGRRAELVDEVLNDALVHRALCSLCLRMLL